MTSWATARASWTRTDANSRCDLITVIYPILYLGKDFTDPAYRQDEGSQESL